MVTKLFSTRLHNFTFLPAICKGSNFCITNTSYFPLKIIIAILVSVKHYLFVVLFCISLMTTVMLSIFLCAFSHLCFLFGEISIQVFCPFLSWVVCLLFVELSKVGFLLILYFIYAYSSYIINTHSERCLTKISN